MVFLLSLIWLFLGVVPVNAASTKDYSITNVTINNTVNTDGSMDVVESRTYKFQGSFSYAYQSINKANSKSKSYSIKDFTLCDELTCYKSAPSTNKTLPPNTFYVDENGRRYYIKWFFRANNQNKTFTLKYKIENVVTLQTDTAEIYWQSIGNETSKSQKNITVRYILPNGIDGAKIKAYGHGPLNGIVSIPSNKEVVFTSPRLPAKTFFENRILLPKDIFTGGLVGKQTLNQIIAEEESFIAKTKAEQDAKKAKDLRFATILFLVLLVQLIFFIKKIIDFNHYSKDKKIPKSGLSGRFWEPPSDIDPSQVEQLLTAKDNLTPKSITATILSLISNKFLKIEREEKRGFFGTKYEYSLSLVENNSSKISSVQQLTLDLIKEIIGDSDKVFLSGITSWFRLHPTKGRQFLLKDFPLKTAEENVAEGYFDKTANDRKKKYVSWFSLTIAYLVPFLVGLVVTLLINFGIYSIILSITNIVVALIIVSIGKKLNENYQKRTDKGLEEASKWLGFKKHLKEYNQTVKDPIDSIVIWEKYLIYGSVLGISLKTLSELPIKLGPEEQQILTNYWSVSDVSNLSNISIFTNSLNSVTSSLNSVSSPSYGASGSGSSGGFSGGGGGGGGGGGCGAG